MIFFCRNINKNGKNTQIFTFSQEPRELKSRIKIHFLGLQTQHFIGPIGKHRQVEMSKNSTADPESSETKLKYRFSIDRNCVTKSMTSCSRFPVDCKEIINVCHVRSRRVYVLLVRPVTSIAAAPETRRRINLGKERKNEKYKEGENRADGKNWE